MTYIGSYMRVAVVAIAMFPGAAYAQSIVCNSTYTTERGDSLSDIARRAYDNPRAYQNIFDVNPGTLTSPNVVPIGVDLYIPCIGADAVEVPSDELPPIRPADGSEIKILTGDNYAPYAGRDLPNEGFSTELIHRALQIDGQPADYRVDIIADWSAHLDPLLSEGAYDIGFPWFKPDCSETSRLGRESTFRCENLLFSQPLHEIVITFYGRSGEVANISEASDAEGITLCRPAGYFTHDLEAMGFVEPTIARVDPATPDECFEMLAAREVDIVSVNADTADRIIREMEMGGRIEEAIDLSSIQTLHAVGMRSSPETRLILRRIDQGLKAIQDRGHFQIVAANHL